MDKINFKNGEVPINDTNLNQMQNNMEKANEQLKNQVDYIANLSGNSNAFGGLIGFSSDLNNTPFLITISNINPTGYPSGLGGNSCLVLTSNSNNKYRGQLALGFGEDKIAIRRCFGSTTWTDWKYVSFS